MVVITCGTLHWWYFPQSTSKFTNVQTYCNLHCVVVVVLVVVFLCCGGGCMYVVVAAVMEVLLLLYTTEGPS